MTLIYTDAVSSCCEISMQLSDVKINFSARIPRLMIVFRVITHKELIDSPFSQLKDTTGPGPFSFQFYILWLRPSVVTQAYLATLNQSSVATPVIA